MFRKRYESVFIIRTPYHYINALEAANRYEINIDESVLVVWSNHFREKFSHVIEKDNWGKIKFLPVVHYENEYSHMGGIRNISKDITYLANASIFMLATGSVKRCITIIPTEKYIQHIINKIGVNEVVIIDEGVGVFSLTREYLKKRKKKVDVKKFRYDRRRDKPYEFFTSYPLEDHVNGVKKKEVTRHSFEVLKSKFRPITDKYEGGLILGTERTENTRDVYEKFISKSLGFMKNSVDDIWYKPHRMENEHQIRNIVESNHLRLIDNALPVEIALLKKAITPKYISGFASTAVHSIREIYGNKIDKIKVFGKKEDGGKDNMAYEYYESLPNDQVNVVYI